MRMGLGWLQMRAQGQGGGEGFMALLKMTAVLVCGVVVRGRALYGFTDLRVCGVVGGGAVFRTTASCVCGVVVGGRARGGGAEVVWVMLVGAALGGTVEEAAAVGAHEGGTVCVAEQGFVCVCTVGKCTPAGDVGGRPRWGC